MKNKEYQMKWGCTIEAKQTNESHPMQMYSEVKKQEREVLIGHRGAILAWIVASEENKTICWKITTKQVLTFVVVQS